MPPAARVGDPTAHPGAITGPGVSTVLIGGQPAATVAIPSVVLVAGVPVLVAATLHACSMPSPAGPHPPTPFSVGSATVLIGGQPALRLGDVSGCGAPIIGGAFNVLIG